MWIKAEQIRLLLFLLLLLADQPLQGQYYNQRQDYLQANSKWAFGKNIGLDFSSGTPVPFRASSEANEGTAAVADRISGDLLFYSDGESCWNRDHQLMPNGTGLLGNRKSATQGTCIIPMIDSPDKYYLFSLQQYEHVEGKLWYSVVDMRLENGLGDVEAGRKNILIDSGLSESMIAIPGDQCDIWLVVHMNGQPVFKAYRITSAGVDPVPVVSNTGVVMSYRQGQMAVSPDRRRIAIGSSTSPGGVVAAWFDPSTGQITNPVLAEAATSCFGVAFSPDNNLLYIRFFSGIPFYSVFQYDLANWSAAAIQASRLPVYHNLRATGTIKSYDGRLYLGDFITTHLDRINYPDRSGAACEYDDTAIRLSGMSGGTLPNDVVLPLPAQAQLSSSRKDTSICAETQQLMLPQPALAPGYTLYGWEDGSRDSTRIITQPGVYWHTTWYPGCRVIVDTFVVRELDLGFRIVGDTVICNGVPVILHIPVPGVSRIWQDGSTDSTLTATNPGRYWAGISRDGCTAYDTVRIGTVNIPLALGNDTLVCATDSIHIPLQAYVPQGAAALWSDGSSGKMLIVSDTGTYWVQVSKDGCTASDTLRIAVPDLRQDLGNDTVFCKRDPIAVALQASTLPGAGILWSDGSTGSTLPVTDSGSYWVMVNYGGCTASDTLHIGKELCDCFFEMPSAFSPNGDGRNDRLRPVIEPGCPVQEFSLLIYNRWGQMLFSGTDPAVGWDGTYNGAAAEMGTYMYIVRFNGGTRGAIQTRTGDITLIR